MESQLENLRLEEGGLEFTDLEEPRVVEEYELCLVGTLITDKAYKISVLKSRMASIWRPAKKMTVTELEGGLILFRFYHPYDLKWVIDNSPWTFENNLLALHRIKAGEEPVDVALHLNEFWVQIYNLPAAFFNEKVGEALGNVIGTYVLYDKQNKKTFERPYLRIRVCVDISKPLKQNYQVRKTGGEWFTCEFRFEKLPSFCFLCGRIGHLDRHCDLFLDSSQPDALVRQWSISLRAPARRNNNLAGDRWLKEASVVEGESSAGSVEGRLMENESLGFNAFNATKPMSKEQESDKANGRNNLKAGVFFSSTETASSGVSTSSPAITSGFLFSGMPSNASITNGAIPTPSVSFADKALVSNTISSQSSSGGSTDAVVRSNSTAFTAIAANSNGSSNLSTSTLTPSSASGSVVPSASTLSTSAATGVELTEPKTKETSFSNLSSVPFSSTLSSISNTGGSIFSGISSAIKSTGSSIVDGTSAVASSSSNSFGLSAAGATTGGSGIFSFNAGGSTAVSNQSQGFNPFSAASTPASSAGTVFSTSSQSIPIQFASTAPAAPFGLTANSAASSGSSSISIDKLFSSGPTSAANPVSSTTSSTPGVFRSSSFVTPIFGSPFTSSSSSTGFAFGDSSASGASTASTSTAPLVFSAFNNASSASHFNFSSPATVTPSQPAFVSTLSSPYPFGSSPGNNDQMNMEDSMAEDTVQATTSTAPAFGQHPITPPSFGFGSATPAGGNQFAPAGAPVVNPFQFGGQPNLAAPQNQSPFQASGSLEFNAGGSFSLGTSDKSNRRIVKVRKSHRKK